MNGPRHVLPKVWNGLRFARQPLFASPVVDRGDRDSKDLKQTSNAGDTNWRAGTEHTDRLLSRLLPRRDVGVALGRGCHASEQICSILEGDAAQSRLDVFPVAIDALLSGRPPVVASKQIPRTSDVCIQTDSSLASQSQGTTTTTADVENMISKFRGSVENAMAVEFAEENLGSEALKAWAGAAARGSLDAIHNVALCYLKGQFVPQSTTKAIELWQKASSRGHALSTYQLAAMELRGAKTPEARQATYALMERAAESGCHEAQFYMAAKLLRDRGGGDSTDAKAERYLREAVRNADIHKQVSDWSRMPKLPAHVRTAVERALKSAEHDDGFQF